MRNAYYVSRRSLGCISVYTTDVVRSNVFMSNYTILCHCLFVCVVSVLDSLSECFKSGTDTTNAHKISADHSLHIEIVHYLQ